MKKFLLLYLISLQGLHAQFLELRETSSHFDLHFSQSDKDTALLLIQELEDLYSTVSQEFNCSSPDLFQVNIYPSMEVYHEALGLINAPKWAVAQAYTHSIDTVSPSNPGPFHSKESLHKIIKLNAVKSLIFNQFGQNQVPYWLAFGIGALKAGYGSSIHPPKKIPSLADLETTDYKCFNEMGGFQTSYALVRFIQDTYGSKALTLILSDYDLYTEALYQEWVQSFSQ